MDEFLGALASPDVVDVLTIMGAIIASVVTVLVETWRSTSTVDPFLCSG